MTKADVTKGLVRYMRAATIFQTPDEVLFAPSNLGGVTFAMNILHGPKKLEVAFAICKADENFSKAAGRDRALDNLSKGAFITINYNSEQTLLQNLVNESLIYNDGTTVNQNLIRTLQATLNRMLDETDDAAEAFEDYRLGGTFLEYFDSVSKDR